MSKPHILDKVKLFIGVIYATEEDLNSCRKFLLKEYGTIDLESSSIPFNKTNYYDYMGNALHKKFFSFSQEIEPEKLPEIKIFTNELEFKLSKEKDTHARTINIDPGYLTLSNIYLASCKPYYHRMYLTNGVYLEHEYFYSAKKWNFWDWTYPDYKQEEYLDFFYKLRSVFKNNLRHN